MRYALQRQYPSPGLHQWKLDLPLQQSFFWLSLPFGQDDDLPQLHLRS